MNTYVRSALLGATTGLRSTAGAFAARWSETNRLPVGSAMALGGEMVADKLPFVPPRTTPGGLVPRIGAAVYAVRSSTKRPTVAAYALGAIAAIGTAALATNLRRMLKERTGVPDFLIGLAEDAVVAGLTYAIVRASD